MGDSVIISSQMAKVPVVMIIFRRPDLTSLVLEAVSKYEPDQLFVIADGPRPSRASDIDEVMETRSLFDQLPWEVKVTRIYADANLGLRERVLSGLDEVFKQVERAVILEDDCLPSPSLFEFCSVLLERFALDCSVGLISGNNFAPKRKVRDTYYFSSHANIWGWATWRRTWLDFRTGKSIGDLDGQDRILIRERIGSAGQRRAFERLLNASEKLDSWAVQFAAFVYLRNLRSAVPSQNLVTNVGFGARSTHTKFESWADEIPLGSLEFPLKHPTSTLPDIREMRRESRAKTFRWIRFPLRHPIESLSRVLRYLNLILTRRKSEN